MVVFPNAKINIGLYVTGKREDGYHDLETFFYPIPIHDVLEFVPSETFLFEHSGMDIPGNHSQNLCVKAYSILKNRFPELPSLHIYLHKIIPIGGGLGGGSSDGSFMLQALNNHFKLGLHEKELSEYALQLGSDCPFFIINQSSIAFGRGEILEPFTINLSNLHLVIINPGIHVNTADAFKGIIPSNPKLSLKEALIFPIEQWKEIIFNDFEKSVFSKYPVIGKLKQTLYDQGAIYASMSGTGSTCYGIFKDKPQLIMNEDYKIVHCSLK